MQLVLLIETDIRASKEFERYLAGNRFRFVNTTSSKKGLEYAKSAPPDLLVIGFHPEERDAVDTLIYLKRDPITKYIPVLALIRESNQPFIDYLQSRAYFWFCWFGCFWRCAKLWYFLSFTVFFQNKKNSH